MRFEERELKPYAEPVSAVDLKEGVIYFSVTFVDDEMLIPNLETLVFIGRELDAGDSGLGRVYFQDINSYRRGVRYGTATDDDYAHFSSGSKNEVRHIFEYEHALEALMACSLRRRKAGLQ